MQFDKKTINRIIRENKETFEMLENYDKTHELPFQRKRIDVTLSVQTINKLKKLREKTGKPISGSLKKEFNFVSFSNK